MHETRYYAALLFRKVLEKIQLIPRESFRKFFQQLQIPETTHKIKGV